MTDFKTEIKREFKEIVNYQTVKNVLIAIVPTYLARYMTGLIQVDMFLSNFITLAVMAVMASIVHLYTNPSHSTSITYLLYRDSNLSQSFKTWLYKNKPDVVECVVMNTNTQGSQNPVIYRVKKAFDLDHRITVGVYYHKDNNFDQYKGECIQYFEFRDRYGKFNNQDFRNYLTKLTEPERKKGVKLYSVLDPHLLGQKKSFVGQGYDGMMLDDTLEKAIINDLEQFKNSLGFYKSLSFRHVRGYLFHGPPGTGKSTLVKRIAAEHGSTIHYMNHNLFNLKNLSGSAYRVESNQIIVFEDIDTYSFLGHRKEMIMSKDSDKGKDEIDYSITLGDVLKWLDDLQESNVIVIMTTNNLDILDKALIRPGRIDRIFELGYCTPSQAKKMIKKMLDLDLDDNTLDIIFSKNKVIPCDLVEFLLQARQEKVDTVESFTVLMKTKLNLK